MLKFSKKIDYGLMAINYMVSHSEDGNANTKQIAAQYNIPVELLAKILQRLAKKGLITSYNGPKGGYGLTKAPARISVADVIEAIEGPIRIADCFHLEGDQATGISRCLQMDRCNIRTPVDRIQASIVRLLEGMTMEQLNQSSEGGNPVEKLSSSFSLEKNRYTTEEEGVSL